jgi:hypothetical protein
LVVTVATVGGGDGDGGGNGDDNGDGGGNVITMVAVMTMEMVIAADVERVLKTAGEFGSVRSCRSVECKLGTCARMASFCA